MINEKLMMLLPSMVVVLIVLFIGEVYTASPGHNQDDADIIFGLAASGFWVIIGLMAYDAVATCNKIINQNNNNDDMQYDAHVRLWYEMVEYYSEYYSDDCAECDEDDEEEDDYLAQVRFAAEVQLMRDMDKDDVDWEAQAFMMRHYFNCFKPECERCKWYREELGSGEQQEQHDAHVSAWFRRAQSEVAKELEEEYGPKGEYSSDDLDLPF